MTNDQIKQDRELLKTWGRNTTFGGSSYTEEFVEDIRAAQERVTRQEEQERVVKIVERILAGSISSDDFNIEFPKAKQLILNQND